MLFHIKELILWPREPGNSPRRLKFEPGKLNVITGASRTGKSAVIPIIDYCLGARSCSIPVETIRIACSWFGVVIQTSDGEKLFARKEPGNLRCTDEMFVMEGTEIEIPNQIIIKNTNADAVRRSLDELSGLSNLDFSAGEQSGGIAGRPSFRDLSAFMFQPQNVIANPDILFFKADTQEHRDKLKTIFPYILNAITPEILAKQHELRRIQRELARKERELKVAQDVSAEWVAEIRSKLDEARELGLISDTFSAQLGREEMILVLNGIVSNTDRTIQVSTETISESVKELDDLEKEESKISQELTTLRRRLSEMRRLRESAGNYQEALTIQRDRLKIADWLVQLHAGPEGCPICGNNLDGNKETLADLHGALKELENSTGVAQQIPAAFERELQRVQEGVSLSTEKLRAVQIRSKALSNRSADAQKKQFQAKKVERFVGGVEANIKTYERLGADSALVAEVTDLKQRVKQLKDEVDAANVKQALQRALAIVNANSAKVLPKLDVERPTDPMALDIDNLTVRVSNLHRDDFLWEIGSGSNWLSYHLAAMLGLHQFFLSLKHSVVPGLLMIDQPSQVYFPKVLVNRGMSQEPTFNRDEDVEAVRMAFSVLSHAVSGAEGRLQIIVLDHAPEEVWDELPNVKLVEEWRQGRTLVPTEWIKP